MIESILVGAGGKLLFNIVNSFFHSRERKAERKYLQDKELLDAHVQLAKINSGNIISNLTRSVCALMIMSTWCFIGAYAMMNPTETDILIPIEHGWLSKFFNQPEAVVKPGRTPGILFQHWFQVTISFVTMFSLPSKQR
jgi:hypothetical protein